MILDSLENSFLIENLHPLFKQAFEYIKGLDLTNLTEGKINIGKFYINVDVIKIKKKEEAILESHNKFIDIQIPITGIETIGWKNKADCQSIFKHYDETSDLSLYKDEISNFIDVQIGKFIIFYPSDAHAPGIIDQIIKKIVIKIPVE